MQDLAIIFTCLIHVCVIVLALKVVHKYEPALQALCPTHTFNPFSYSAVRMWSIVLSLLVSMGFLLTNLQFLVAPNITLSLQYIMLDCGAAVQNLNYLILMLLEKRKT